MTGVCELAMAAAYLQLIIQLSIFPSSYIFFKGILGEIIMYKLWNILGGGGRGIQGSEETHSLPQATAMLLWHILIY